MKYKFICKQCDGTVYTHDAGDQGIGTFNLMFRCTNCHREIKKEIKEIVVRV
jgi:hypothetical protein